MMPNFDFLLGDFMATQPWRHFARFRATATIRIATAMVVLAAPGLLLGEDAIQPYIPSAPVKTSRSGEKFMAVPPLKESREAVALPVLSSNSTAEQISLYPGFPEPLKPVGNPVGDPATSDLSKLINDWSERKAGDDFTGLEGFAEKHPDSVWTLGIQYNLAKLYFSAGYFSRSIDTYQELQGKLAGVKGEAAEILQSNVAAELAGMYARTGRQKELADLLAAAKGQVFADNAKVQVDRAREGLDIMKSQPGIAFQCGPYALANLAKIMALPAPGEFMEKNPSTSEGFSLAQLKVIAAEQLNLPLTVINRKKGGIIPVPAVIHLRCGHYAALMEKTNGQFLLSDPTFGKDIWMTTKAIDDEASGYFLVPASQLNKGDFEVSANEAGGIYGKGYVTALDPKATKRCDMSSQICQGPPGMAGYRFHLLAASLSVSDTPLVIPTGYGPGLGLDVTYNLREAGQASTRLYTQFGPQWVSGLVSHLDDDTTNDAGSVTVYLPGGGSEVHSNYTAATAGQGYLGAYGLQRESQSRLYRISPGQYERRSMDGSKLVYQRAIGTSGTARSVFLSQIVDAQGNALTFSYDSVMLARISFITSATGQSLYFFYADAVPPIDPYLVTAVADHPVLAQTGRKASFIYSSQKRLISITDPLGIVSSFVYDATTGFMKSMTTPYGVTTFMTGGGEEPNLLRWLEAKDPQGSTERVEFRNDVDINSVSASPIPSGDGISTLAQYRNYRNTFYWDKKAWAMAPGDRSKAHLYHWLHAPDGTGAFGVLEMEKPAFENNIWYNYVNPSGGYSYNAGPSASPSIISRAVEGPSGAVESSIQRFEYHPLTGNLTLFTNPVGQVTRNTYDTTGYDLLAVEVKNGATWDLIGSYADYLNHQPRTVTDAQGQVTYFTFTISGQIQTIKNALNEVTTLTYETNPAADGYGKVKTIVGAQPGATTGIAYDTLDRIRTITDSSGHITTYDYDVFDRITLVTYPDTTTEQNVYDRLDLFAQKDRQGRWNRTWHNALRQPVLTADALGQSIRYEWCKCGALQKLTDAKGQVTSWKYDAQARNTEKTYADGRKESSAYEPLSGRLNSSTDAKGQIKSFSYYLDNSVKSYAYSNATISTAGVSYTYDPVHPRIATMTDGTGLTSYTYKPVGQLGALNLATIDGPLSGQTDLITYTYDPLGRGKNRNIGPLGTENLVTLNYDNLGRMTSIINPLGTFGHFYVGATDRTDYITYPNGQKTSFGYFGNTGDNRLQTITHLANGANPASTLSKFDYTYQPDGNIATWQRQTGSDPATALTLGYDLANQLTFANLAPVATPASITQRYSYQYDKAGNRTSRQVGNEVTSASHNNVNQITSMAGGGQLLVAGNTDEPAKVKVNGKLATVSAPPQNLYQAWIDVTPGVNSISIEATDYAPTSNTTTKAWTVSVTGGAARSFSYDTNGNTLSDGLRTYEWDAENRLVKITQGTNVYEFTYDGISRRVAEKLNGTLTKRWVWNGTQIAEQRDATGNTVQRQYYNQSEKRIGGTDAGNYYYTRDHLGSIREMTDSSATVRARYDFDPYGSRSKLTGDLDCDFGFTGHNFHSASNLHLTLYRAYDQDLGRWLSADPIGEGGGLNLYGYVDSNPVRWLDKFGLMIADPKSQVVVAKLRESKVGAALVNMILKCEKKTGRQIRISHDVSADPIYSNMSGDIVIGKLGDYKDADGESHRATNEQILMHELWHAYEGLDGVGAENSKNKKCSPGYPTVSEQNAVNRENLYLKEMLKPLRKDYYSFKLDR